MDEKSFNLYNKRGKEIGYGVVNNGAVAEIYLLSSIENDYIGAVAPPEVEFSGGNVAGFVKCGEVYYEDETIAGRVVEQEIFDSDGELVGFTRSSVPVDLLAGAALLLIFNRWFMGNGTRNPDFV